jgi:hypothetical protein
MRLLSSSTSDGDLRPTGGRFLYTSKRGVRVAKSILASRRVHTQAWLHTIVGYHTRKSVSVGRQDRL